MEYCIGFPNDGTGTFHDMAKRGIFIIDRVVQEEMGSSVDLKNKIWLIPDIK